MVRTLMRVLIAEDEDFERTAIKFLINKYYSDRLQVVGEAANGQQAIDKAAELKPDIVLMDINMPVVDGLKAGEQIKQFNKNIEIVILTAYNYFEYAKKGIQIGVHDYLLKPYSNEEFIGSMDKLIERVKERKNLKLSVEDITEQGSESSSHNNVEIVEAAKKYIQMNYTKEISLEDIANYVSVSSFYLSRIFGKKEGMTYKDYLIKLRMEKAMKLIKEGRKSIKEISIEVGYADQNYFSKAFKKYYDKSPKEFGLNREKN
jgi:two-component system, response regulator YesN